MKSIELFNEKKELIKGCYEVGMENDWASGRNDMLDGGFIVEEDRLNLNSISIINTIEELTKEFREGNKCLGTGYIHSNLFFLQQVNGGDEWAVYKINENEIFPFESVSFGRMIEKDGDRVVSDFVERASVATDEELKGLEY